MCRGDSIRLAVVLAGVVLLSGCLGRSEDPAQQGRPFTAEEVAARFHAITGDTLDPSPVLDLRRIGGGRSISLRSEGAGLSEKYGEFRFFVQLEQGEDPFFKFGPDSTAERPDEEGIIWELGLPDDHSDVREPYWSATKYRGNVSLTWFPPDKQHRTNEHWRVLDEVLMSLRPK